MHRATTPVIAFLAALVLFGCSPADAQLETRSSYGTYTATCCVVAADFNRDGIMDMAVGSFEGSSGVQVFLGKRDGSFGPSVSYDPGTGANAIATGDLNHDGIPDLVIVSSTLNRVDVLLGNGDGTFQAPVSYATPLGPNGVVLGDFNGDANLDIAVSEYPGVSVFLGSGDGTFQPAITTPVGSVGPTALAAGYFTRSSHLDLAVTANDFSVGKVLTLLGNGDGTFTLGQSQTITPDTLSIVAADLRSEGKTDLVAAEFGGMGVAVLLGNGDGTFQQPVVYDVGVSLAAAVGDLNGDGIPELVALSANNAGSVAVFLGNGDGTFRNPQYFSPPGQFPRALALADLNGDGQLDVTFADQLADREFVLLNTGAVTFSPSGPLVFGNQKHGTTSKAKGITLTNNGTSALSIHSVRALGPFGVTSTCGKSVAAGANCTISVTFSPTSVGATQGVVEINDSGSSKPQVVALNGTGT